MKPTALLTISCLTTFGCALPAPLAESTNDNVHAHGEPIFNTAGMDIVGIPGFEQQLRPAMDIFQDMAKELLKQNDCKTPLQERDSSPGHEIDATMDKVLQGREYKGWENLDEAGWMLLERTWERFPELRPPPDSNPPQKREVKASVRALKPDDGLDKKEKRQAPRSANVPFVAAQLFTPPETEPTWNKVMDKIGGVKPDIAWDLSFALGNGLVANLDVSPEVERIMQDTLDKSGAPATLTVTVSRRAVAVMAKRGTHTTNLLSRFEILPDSDTILQQALNKVGGLNPKISLKLSVFIERGSVVAKVSMNQITHSALKYGLGLVRGAAPKTTIRFHLSRQPNLAALKPNALGLPGAEIKPAEAVPKKTEPSKSTPESSHAKAGEKVPDNVSNLLKAYAAEDKEQPQTKKSNSI